MHVQFRRDRGQYVLPSESRTEKAKIQTTNTTRHASLLQPVGGGGTEGLPL